MDTEDSLILKNQGHQPTDFWPVDVSEQGSNQVSLSLDAPAAGFVVLTDTLYPGWQATVNDTPQPVEKVNGLLRGLYLSQPGSYQITMEYRPRSVLWGSWISGVTVGLMILIGLFYFATCTTYRYFFTGRVVLEGNNCCSSSIKLRSRSTSSNSVSKKIKRRC